MRGDDYYRVELYNNKWILSNFTKNNVIPDLIEIHAVVHSPSSAKAFVTKQAALDWIEKQKPKDVEVKLFGGNSADVSKSSIRIFNGHIWVNIKPSDLEDIMQALKSL